MLYNVIPQTYVVLCSLTPDLVLKYTVLIIIIKLCYIIITSILFRKQFQIRTYASQNIQFVDK